MNPMSTAPRDGTPVNVFFDFNPVPDSCTSWLVKEGRWNGMCKGEEPVGWMPAGMLNKLKARLMQPEARPAPDPFS